jgi:hypothetical protein
VPFFAHCPYCQRGVHAPDRALAASVKCPGCESWYTAVPQDEPKPPKLTAPAQAGLIAPTLTPATATPPAPAAPAPMPAPAPLLSERFESPAEDSPGSRRRPPLLGVAACLLAGAALLSAAWGANVVLIRPLAGVGLVLGVVGALAVRGGKPVRLTLPIVGAVVSGLGLLVALFIPSLLGPRYEASPEKPNSDLEAIRVIPLRLDGGAVGGLESDGYADASRATVQQDFIRVQVTAASVGPVQVVDSKKRFTEQPYLAVVVRVQHLGHGEDLRFTHWGATGERTVPPAVARSGGNTLAVANLGRDVPVGVTFGHDLFRGTAVDDVLLFEPPPGGLPVLLDLPWEAWGRERVVFKFQIPGSMIATQLAK